MSLSKTLYPQISIGSTQENPSWHDWKIVDWDVKNQTKKPAVPDQLAQDVHFFPSHDDGSMLTIKLHHWID